MSDDPRLRHDDETVELGRREISKFWEARGGRPPHQDGDRPRRDLTVERRAAAGEPAPAGEWSPDRMSAEMAAAAEREGLRDRIVQLEAEVGQLRTALAAVMRSAAAGLDTPAELKAPPNPPEQPGARRTPSVAPSPTEGKGGTTEPTG